MEDSFRAPLQTFMYFRRRDDYMKSHLIDLERKALQLRNAGRLKEAAELFAAIVKDQPDWEHGTAFYNLACCYEDLAELALAEHCFSKALDYDPKSPIFLGGHAAFLYIHGDPSKAFSSYLNLLERHKVNNDQKGIESAMIALKTLGKQMGISDEAVAERIEKPSIRRS